jgi:hypothetical protein
MNAETRAVLVLIDGARADVLRQLLARGDLPNLSRWVIEPGGLGVGTTVFPSTTGVAYIPFLFGRYPGSVGIPGIRWLDRRGAAAGTGWRAQWRAARSYCGVQGGWLNSDIVSAPSLFDLVPSIAICTPLTRGLGAGANRIPGRRVILGSAAHYIGTYPALDRAVARAWLDAAGESWRFMFVVFPGVDGISHLKDPVHPAVLESYRLVDRALGAFVERVRRTGRELPAFFVVSDHGMTVMREHDDVAVLLEGAGIRTLRHPAHVWRREARAATMVSGNASVQLYFDPRSGRERPRTESEIPRDLLERLLALPAVRLGACRDDSGGVVVRTKSARARLTETGGLVRYEPLDGDPLGLGGSLALDDRELLARTRETDVPDAPRQLLQLFHSTRSGDLVLAAANGSDFRGPWEIPEHRAGHGSLIAEHMEVPIAASVALPEAPVRTVDLMPTILERLGVAVPEGIVLDGVPFSRLAATTQPLIR